MSGVWMHLVDSPAVVGRLLENGIEDTSKWMDRIKQMATKDKMLSHFSTLRNGDLLDIQDAITAAGTEQFAFAQGVVASGADDLKGGEGGDTEVVHIKADLAVGVQKKNIREKTFAADELPPANKGFRFSTTASFKFSVEFSSFTAAIAAAGDRAQSSWYPKFCKAFSQAVATRLATPYYVDDVAVRDLLTIADISVPNLMKTVEFQKRESTLKAAFGRLTKIDGMNYGVLNDNNEHAMLLAAWGKRGVAFTTIEYSDWLCSLPKLSQMAYVRMPYMQIAAGRMAPTELLDNLEECMVQLRKEELGWIPHLFDLPTTRPALLNFNEEVSQPTTITGTPKTCPKKATQPTGATKVAGPQDSKQPTCTGATKVAGPEDLKKFLFTSPSAPLPQTLLNVSQHKVPECGEQDSPAAAAKPSSKAATTVAAAAAADATPQAKKRSKPTGAETSKKSARKPKRQKAHKEAYTLKLPYGMAKRSGSNARELPDDIFMVW